MAPPRKRAVTQKTPRVNLRHPRETTRGSRKGRTATRQAHSMTRRTATTTLLLTRARRSSVHSAHSVPRRVVEGRRGRHSVREVPRVPSACREGLPREDSVHSDRSVLRRAVEGHRGRHSVREVLTKDFVTRVVGRHDRRGKTTTPLVRIAFPGGKETPSSALEEISGNREV